MAEFSKDGRKLRPRRASASSKPAYSTAEKHGEGHGSNYEGHKNYGEHRNGGKSYASGSDRHKSSYGGDRRQGGYAKNGEGYGEHRSGGQGEHRSYGSKSYGEKRQGGYAKSGEGYGEHRSGSQGEHRSYSSKSYGEKRQGGYGRKPSYGSKSSKNNSFNKASDEGINRMIAESPVKTVSDFDSAPNLVQEEIRLNKFIANSGVCSRREADTMIQAGVVTVNDVVVTELGTKVNVLTDVVKFNGETLRGEAKVYIVMNKPRGYVTTASDPHAEKTVMDLLKGCHTRVYPVGRLDKATTGVLMFTNDGEISERLTHPSYDKKKIYQVILARPLSEEARQQILSGVELSDGVIAADALEYIDPDDKRKLGIEIHSGKNRVVRRIFEAVGNEVRTLDRVYFAGLTKKGLKKGEWRYLTEGEVNILKMGAYV